MVKTLWAEGRVKADRAGARLSVREMASTQDSTAFPVADSFSKHRLSHQLWGQEGLLNLGTVDTGAAEPYGTSLASLPDASSTPSRVPTPNTPPGITPGPWEAQLHQVRMSGLTECQALRSREGRDRPVPGAPSPRAQTLPSGKSGARRAGAICC